MKTREQIIQDIQSLKDGDNYEFNFFQDGGSTVYNCNGMYLLFVTHIYGDTEDYDGIYYREDIDKLVETGLSYT